MSPPNQDFTSIRRRAIEKRDEVIAHARREYAATLVTAIAAAVGLSRPTIYDVLAVAQ